MNGYEQFLVVVLSSFLAIFLLVGIVLMVVLIKVIRSIKRITDKAERLADKAEAIGEFFEHASGPMAIGRLLSMVNDKFFSKRSKRKD
jgi:hypothetical protein